MKQTNQRQWSYKVITDDTYLELICMIHYSCSPITTCQVIRVNKCIFQWWSKIWFHYYTVGKFSNTESKLPPPREPYREPMLQPAAVHQSAAGPADDTLPVAGEIYSVTSRIRTIQPLTAYSAALGPGGSSITNHMEPLQLLRYHQLVLAVCISPSCSAVSHLSDRCLQLDRVPARCLICGADCRLLHLKCYLFTGRLWQNKCRNTEAVRRVGIKGTDCTIWSKKWDEIIWEKGGRDIKLQTGTNFTARFKAFSQHQRK